MDWFSVWRSGGYGHRRGQRRGSDLGLETGTRGRSPYRAVIVDQKFAWQRWRDAWPTYCCRRGKSWYGSGDVRGGRFFAVTHNDSVVPVLPRTCISRFAGRCCGIVCAGCWRRPLRTVRRHQITQHSVAENARRSVGCWSSKITQSTWSSCKVCSASWDSARSTRPATASASKRRPRNAYDLILMDCQMPRMDGLEGNASPARNGGTYADCHT